MENVAISRLMRLISPLSVESKLEILSKISENLKIDLSSKKSDKEDLLDELFGSWKDMRDGLVDEIMNSRTSSGKEINLD